MKSIRIIQLLIIVILLQPMCIAGTKSGNTRNVHIYKKDENNTKKRPRAPSRQYITCYYENGQINISFNIYEGDATLTIEDEIRGICDVTTFDTAVPTIYTLGELNDNLILRIETAYGNVYEGYLTE